MTEILVGSQGVSNLGTPVIAVTLAKDSENQGIVVVYTSRTGIYWVMPREDYEQEPLVLEGAEPATFTVAMGRYAHFKGTTYKVVCRARDPRTGANLIVYENPEGLRWVRPETMFLEEVVWPDGLRRPRFSPIED